MMHMQLPCARAAHQALDPPTIAFVGGARCQSVAICQLNSCADLEHRKFSEVAILLENAGVLPTTLEPTLSSQISESCESTSIKRSTTTRK